MSTEGVTVYRHVRRLSVISAATVTVASAALEMANLGGSQAWQVWLAVIALAIGIPHGALDHLVTVPSMKASTMTIFISAYLAVVAVVALAIMVWPLWGFIGVVVMSAVHFGMGDASFVRQGSPPHLRHVPWWVYAIPAGAIPVVIPLTREGSSEALSLVNRELINWHLGAATPLFWSSVAAAVLSILWLGLARRFADARDLGVLLALALVAPPLVAFAASFGLWHALRHTARLSLEFPKATAAVSRSQWLRGLWLVTVPGLPALVGTMLVAAGITFLTDLRLADYFFVALALVWALTVPHMALTWRLDREALGISGLGTPMKSGVG